MSLTTVRNSRRAAGQPLPIQHVEQDASVHGGAKSVAAKNFGAPEKTRPFATYPATGVPPASEETSWPSKEGPPANPNTR